MRNQLQAAPSIRFKGFTDAWEERTLGDLAEIVRGASPRPIKDSKWFDSESDIGWMRISDVTEQNGRIHYLEQRISDAGQEKTRVLTESHLLLTIAATVGKPVINYVKTGVHDGFLIFLNPKFNREFMFQWLEMFRPKWQEYGQPGSQVNLNSELVKNREIMLPNEEEQSKIGAFFKQLDDTITLQQQQLSNYKEMKTALLQKMFPKAGEKMPEVRFEGFTGEWEERKLGEIARIATGKLDANAMKENGKYPFFTCAEETYRTDTFAFDSEALLIAGNGNIGSVKYCNGKFNAYQRTYVLTNILPNAIFLKHSLSRNLPERIKRTKYGSAMPYIVLSTLSEMLIAIPPLPEQQKIADFFSVLDEQIEAKKAVLAAMQRMKQGLLQQMFV